MKKNNSASNKAIDKIHKDIEKEQARLSALERKRSEIDNDIKASKSEISKLNEQLRQEKFNIIDTIINGNGVTVDELLRAAESGDFLSFQEKIEDNAKADNKDSASEPSDNAI